MRNREPILFCFCGPSGSGKSSVCVELLRHDSGLRLSISTTTRPPRPGEREGEDYFFVAEDDFSERIAAGAFLEHAEYGGHRYGTEKRNIALAEAEGRDVLLDIDVEGVRQLKSVYSGSVVTIFVSAPSFAELEKRLRGRKTEDEQRVQSRLRRAREEVAILRQTSFSDYLLVNSKLQETVALASVIVQAERVRLSRLDPKELDGLLR